MKKYLILFFIASLTLSCSSNSDDLEDVDPVNVSNKKPLTIKYEGQNIAFDLITISYDNDGKLISLEDPSINYLQEYIYLNGNLSEVKNYNNNSFSSKNVYEYTNDLISKNLSYNSNNELTRTRTFTYNNGIVESYTDEYVNSSSSNATYDYEYNQTDNSVKRTNRGNPQMYSITTYDEKKRPFYTIPFYVASAKSLANINSNNPIQIVNYFNGSITSTITFQNEYDTDEFLSKVTSFNNGIESRVEKYTYNQ